MQVAERVIDLGSQLHSDAIGPDKAIAQGVDGRWYIIWNFPDGDSKWVASFPSQENAVQWAHADAKYWRAFNAALEAGGEDVTLSSDLEESIFQFAGILAKGQDQQEARDEAHDELFKRLGGLEPQDA